MSKQCVQGHLLYVCIYEGLILLCVFSLTYQAQQDTHSAALRYERAVSMHAAAREMVFVAEQGVTADKNRLDPTWQEMLNHATCKVREGGQYWGNRENAPSGLAASCYPLGPWCHVII